MNESQKNGLERIGAFWKQKSRNGTDYLRGEVHGERVVVFHVKEKRTKYSPDYHVFKSLPESTEKASTDGNADKDKGKDQQKPEDVPF